MEPLNISLKNIIQFILCIQDACDKHRKCMDYLWQQEYSTYITEWKPSQIEPKMPNVNNHEVKSHNASKCIPKKLDDDCDDLELFLADSLLEKARSIRTKNKKLMNELIDSKNLPTNCSDKIVTSSGNSDLNVAPVKVMKSRILPHSKSEFSMNNHKSNVVQMSKSATIPFITRKCSETYCEHCDCRNCAALLSKNNVKKHTNNDRKTSKDFAVISRKDLDRIKSLQLNNLPCHKPKEKKVVLPSDSSEKTKPAQISTHPSSTEFLSLMKSRLSIISSEMKLKLWYPFLSSKSEIFLTAFNYNSLSSIKEVYSILYSIQETMMWIDLLHLLEAEICPNLIVDVTDVNSLRIWSYLQSIFHPTSQRVPIEFPLNSI